jgi:hypothetical protein
MTLPFDLVKYLNITEHTTVIIEEKDGIVTLSFVNIPSNNNSSNDDNKPLV